MSTTTTTLSPLLQTDLLAPRDNLGPTRFNASAAHIELEDYQECYQLVKENCRDISEIMKDLNSESIIPDEETLNNLKKKMSMSFLLSKQFQNYRRKVRLLSPHELTSKLKKELREIEIGGQQIINKSAKKLKLMSEIAEAYFGRPLVNLSSPPTSPKTPFRQQPLNEPRGERKRNLSIDVRTNRPPILCTPDSPNRNS